MARVQEDQTHDARDDEDPEACPACEIRAFQPAFDEEASDDQRHGQDPRIGEEIWDVVCARRHVEPVLAFAPS